jgi:hypothetical protein
MSRDFIPAQCSEREAGQWEDCTWATGVMLNNAAHGANVAPSTRTEYEALRVAGGDGPAENSGNGSNHAQLVAGISHRYHWTPTRIGPPGAPKPSWQTVLSHLDQPGDCAALQGSMGVWSPSSHWRRWDVPFHGAHDVYVQRIDAQPRLWWMNPQAPNSYAGEWIPLNEARRYYDGFTGGVVLARVGFLAPPVEAPPLSIGKKPAGATMWVETDDLARLFAPGTDGILRPVTSSSGSFTFTTWAGPNVTKVWAPGPASNARDTAVFRRVMGPVHTGKYIRVTDQGSTWHHA